MDQLDKEFPTLYGNEVSLQCSKNPAIISCTELDESNAFYLFHDNNNI
jgi:hypothetical protein